MTEHRAVNTSPLPVKLRIEDYMLLDEQGAFDAYRKTELIDGKVYYMNAQHRPHARVKSRLFRLLSDALGGQASLEAVVEGSIAIPPVNVPEPDIVVTSEIDGEGLIPIHSVRLIVEVADSTVRRDLSTKARIYARAGVPEYWVVNVKASTITQMWSPGAKGYAEQREIDLGERLEAVTLAAVAVETGGL